MRIALHLLPWGYGRRQLWLSGGMLPECTLRPGRTQGHVPSEAPHSLEGLWLQAHRIDNPRLPCRSWGWKGRGDTRGGMDRPQHRLALFFVVVKHSSLHPLVLRSNEE